MSTNFGNGVQFITFYESEINNNTMNHLVDYLRFWHKQGREKHRIDFIMKYRVEHKMNIMQCMNLN